jgi:hypothetical protein
MDDEIRAEDVLEAIGWFCAYASDQLRHVEGEDVEYAAYVGRRLDQAWRTLDFKLTLWLEPRFQSEVTENHGRSAVDTALKKLKQGAPPTDHASTLMGRLLHASLDIIGGDLANAVDAGDVAAAAGASYVGRRWYTKYRVLKWRWLEQHAGEVPPYRWFEA